MHIEASLGGIVGYFTSLPQRELESLLRLGSYGHCAKHHQQGCHFLDGLHCHVILIIECAVNLQAKLQRFIGTADRKGRYSFGHTFHSKVPARFSSNGPG